MLHDVSEAANEATVLVCLHTLKVCLDDVNRVVEHGGAETGEGT